MRRHHWDSCAAALWLLLFLVGAPILLATCGCGNSRFLEAPPPNEPDTSNCVELERTFTGTAPFTPLPMPFSGTRKVKMWSSVPVGWDGFGGTVHLMSAEWGVTWIRSLRIGLGPYPRLAVWEQGRWDTDPRIDIRQYLIREGDFLVAEPEFTARGLKPAGKTKVPITVTFAVCGPGAQGVR